MHVIIVAAGVGLLVAKSPVLFETIRYLGAAYLVYLGVRMLLTRPSTAVVDGDQLARDPEGAWSMLRRGLWVNLLNPKAIVFFLAFVPQFVRLDQPQLPQYVILIVTVMIVDIIVMWGFFATAARPFRRLTATVRGQRVFTWSLGVQRTGGRLAMPRQKRTRPRQG